MMRAGISACPIINAASRPMPSAIAAATRDHRRRPAATPAAPLRPDPRGPRWFRRLRCLDAQRPGHGRMRAEQKAVAADKPGRCRPFRSPRSGCTPGVAPAAPVESRCRTPGAMSLQGCHRFPIRRREQGIPVDAIPPDQFAPVEMSADRRRPGRRNSPYRPRSFDARRPEPSPWCRQGTPARRRRDAG